MIFFFVLLLSYYVFCICVYELCLLVLCDGCACLSELNYWGADASEILELRGGGCLVLARVSCVFSVATRLINYQPLSVPWPKRSKTVPAEWRV